MTSQKVKIAVIEDEALLAQDIALRLSKHYEVAGTAPSVEEALELLEQSVVDMLLIDIKLSGDRDGIDLAAIINERYQLPFIFLTSYSDKDLVDRAREVQPAAYMLKPYNDREIQIAIELALSNFANAPKNPELHKQKPFKSEENEVLNISDRLFLKKDHHFQRVFISDISLLEADGNYTTIYAQSEKFIYTTLLKKMEEKLPGKQFLRVHRSYIVHIDAVEGFEGNRLFIKNQQIPVGKQYRDRVFKIFNPF